MWFFCTSHADLGRVLLVLADPAAEGRHHGVGHPKYDGQTQQERHCYADHAHAQGACCGEMVLHAVTCAQENCADDEVDDGHHDPYRDGHADVCETGAERKHDEYVFGVRVLGDEKNAGRPLPPRGCRI